MALHFCQSATSRIVFRLSAQIRARFLGLVSGRCIGTGSWFCGVCGSVIAFSLVLPTQGRAEDYNSPELIEPPVCSPLKPIPPELKKYCEITELPGIECHPISPTDKCHKIKVNLDAKEVKDDIGGYTVATENYNGSYLTPVIEALPGDTVGAYFVNNLPSSEMKCPPNNAICTVLGARLAQEEEKHENATNLHYFHGGIVTPRNARPMDARLGTGDNIYVWLKKGSSFELSVPIPGKDQLDARVLEGYAGTYISHPNGLDWYHSHLHGISSTQVMGGLSGLLSVGEDKAAVKAKCLDTPEKCENETEELRKRTIVRYALLRDISLKAITAPPESTQYKAAEAEWAPEQVDFTGECKVYKTTNPKDPGETDAKLRQGFCQRDPTSAWLFTLNGQRFPTIRIQAGQNLLLRLGNLSSNVAYWLELGKTPKHEPDPGTIVPLTIVALDGVVPARPKDPTQPGIPVEAISTNDLLLMSASRAEIYIRNDETEHEKELVYFLRTKGLDTGSDKWPEIQLARIVLEPSKPVRPIALALNVPVEKARPSAFAARVAETMPQGCVGDLNPDSNQFEHRRVTFTFNDTLAFAIQTEIMHPPTQQPPPEGWQEDSFISDPNREVAATSFEDYELPDGEIDWDAANGHKHPCIHLDHKGSHKQLWVLRNFTGMLHNFHIHQMKFRLATTRDLREHRINPPQNSQTCKKNGEQNGPCYKLYDDSPGEKNRRVARHNSRTGRRE